MANVPLLKKNTGIFVWGINRLENVEQTEICILSASCKGLKFCISDGNQKKTMEPCEKIMTWWEEHDVESLPKKRGSLENFTCQPFEQFSTTKWNTFVTKQTGRRQLLSGEVSKARGLCDTVGMRPPVEPRQNPAKSKAEVFFRDVWALCEVFTQARLFGSGRWRRVTVSAGVRDEKLFKPARWRFFYRSPQELNALFSTVFTLPTICCRVKDNGLMEREQRKMEKRCSLWVLCKCQAEDIMSRCFDF